MHPYLAQSLVTALALGVFLGSDQAILRHDDALVQAVEPGDSMPNLDTARTLMTEGHINEAIAAYRQVLASGDDASVRAELADGLLLMGRLDEALNEYLLAIQDSGRDLSISSGAIKALLLTEHYPEAEQLALELVTLWKDDPLSHFLLGEVLHHVGRCDEAVSAYERALDIDAQYEPAAIGVDQCMEAADVGSSPQEKTEAEGLFARYKALRARVDKTPMDAGAFFEYGDLLAEMGLWPGAADAYQRSADLAPSCAQCYFALGNARYVLGDWESALAATETARRLGYDDAEQPWLLALTQGNILDKLGRHKEAAVLYKEYTASSPVAERVLLYHLTGALYRAGLHTEAWASLQRAESLGLPSDPEVAEALRNEFE